MTTTMVDTLQKHPNMLHLSKFQATLPNSRSINILAFWGAFYGYIHYAWRPGIIWQFVVQSFKLPVFGSHLLLSPVYIVLMLYFIWQHNKLSNFLHQVYHRGICLLRHSSTNAFLDRGCHEKKQTDKLPFYNYCKPNFCHLHEYLSQTEVQTVILRC